MQTMSSRFRFISGFVIASLIFGFSAIAVNVNNTPEGGYLLCANNRTKVVTFPGTLKCPSGTTPIQVPGNGNYISDSEESNPSPKSSPTRTNNNTKGSSKCVLSVLQANPKVISEIVPLCSSEQLSKLQSDLSNFDREAQLRLDTELKKAQALQKDADTKKGTAGAQAAADAVEKQAKIVNELVANIKSSTTILTAIVAEISKRVTG